MKKAQMKIQQMAFMLMAIVLFFILAALFWLAVQYVQIHKQATSLEREKAIITTGFLGESAEFTCGDYCVDTDRLIILKNKEVYSRFGFWPYAYIKVRKIGRESEIECNKGNYPNCNLYTVYDSGKQSTGEAQSFVALCRKEIIDISIYEKCELGFLKIGYEVK